CRIRGLVLDTGLRCGLIVNQTTSDFHCPSMSAGEKECNLLTVFKPKGGHVQARDVMSRQVSIVNPSTKLRVAAQKMEEGGFGALPVVDQDRLIGMVTDRDITIRAVSKGL